MKIAVIGPTYPYRGGISHYNTLLCENLAKKHDVTAISFTRLYPKILFPGRDQKDLESKEKIGFNFTEMIDSINPLTWLKTYNYIKENNFDLLILYWWTPYFSFVFSKICKLVKKNTKTKILFICHNVLPHDKSILDRFFTKKVLRYGNFFIVHSTQDKNNLLQILPNANVKTGVHPTYEIFKVKEVKKDINYLKLRKKVILFFGFVREYKGLMYLIKAMPQILKEVDLDLLIVGEFWKDKQKYIDEIERLRIKDNVKIVDSYVPNEEVGNYFESADIVVLPYLTATNSGIVQTAFGFNKPVIVTNVGGLPEVVNNNKTGLVVPSQDGNALANSVIFYYRNHKKQEFINNIKKEKARFSWGNMVKLIEGFK